MTMAMRLVGGGGSSLAPPVLLAVVPQQLLARLDRRRPAPERVRETRVKRGEVVQEAELDVQPRAIARAAARARLMVGPERVVDVRASAALVRVEVDLR